MKTYKYIVAILFGGALVWLLFEPIEEILTRLKEFGILYLTFFIPILLVSGFGHIRRYHWTAFFVPLRSKWLYMVTLAFALGYKIYMVVI